MHEGVELEINGITPVFLGQLKDVDLLAAFELVCAEVNQRLDLYIRISVKAKKMFAEMPDTVANIRSNMQEDKPVSIFKRLFRKARRPVRRES